jgi:hypothetical protein
VFLVALAGAGIAAVALLALPRGGGRLAAAPHAPRAAAPAPAAAPVRAAA